MNRSLARSIDYHGGGGRWYGPGSTRPRRALGPADAVPTAPTSDGSRTPTGPGLGQSGPLFQRKADSRPAISRSFARMRRHAAAPGGTHCSPSPSISSAWRCGQWRLSAIVAPLYRGSWKWKSDTHRESRSSRINRALSENDRGSSRCLHRSDSLPASRMVSVSAARSRIVLISCSSGR